MSLTFHFRHNETDNLPRDASARLNLAMGRAISGATAILHTLAYINIPKKTGRTASTINQLVIGAGSSNVTGYVGSDDQIAMFLEFGTSPHRIRPVVKQALWWPGLPHPIAYADHPGTPAYLWLTRAGPPAGDIAKGLLRQAFASVFG